MFQSFLFLESFFGLVYFMKAQPHPVHVQEVVDVLPGQTGLRPPPGTGAGARSPEHSSESLQQDCGQGRRGWRLLGLA